MVGAVPSAEWLERANRLALTARLLASTVHDINNALQVISGNGELLEQAPGADEKTIRRAQTIRSHARRASGLLTELMAFVKDVSDRRQPVALHAVATQAVALRQYALTKLRITTALDGDQGMVVASPRHVVQIVLNLIANAEQSLAGQAGAALRIVVTADGALTRVSVADNGPGLDEAAERRLFALPDYGAAGGALGIGLVVSKWLAEQQGGTLTYERPATGGSSFTLSLPSA